MVTRLAGQRGFTLTELLVGLALTALLLGGIAGILSTSLNIWQSIDGRIEIRQTARYASDIMTRDLRYGDHYELESGHSLKYYDMNAKGTYRFFLDAGRICREKVNDKHTGKQPITGGSIDTIVISKVMQDGVGQDIFNITNNGNTVTINFLATDTSTKQTYMVRSSVTSITALE